MKNIACAVRWLVLCVVVLSARPASADQKLYKVDANGYTGTLEIVYKKNGLTFPNEHTYGEVFINDYVGRYVRRNIASLPSNHGLNLPTEEPPRSVRVEIPQSALQGGNQLPQIELMIVSGHLRVGQELQIITTRWVQ